MSRSTTPDYPELTAKAGENPCRFLDRDLPPLTNGSGKHIKTHAFPVSRIDGIDSLDVCDAWIEAEIELARDDGREARSPVIARLNKRKQQLRQHGERQYTDMNRAERVRKGEKSDTEKGDVNWVDREDGARNASFRRSRTSLTTDGGRK